MLEYRCKNRFDEIMCEYVSALNNQGKSDVDINRLVIDNDNIIDLLEATNKSFLNSIIDGYRTFSSDCAKAGDENRLVIAQTWGKGLALLKMQYEFSLLILDEYRDLVTSSHVFSEKRNVITCLDHITGRALQVFKSIICLLENGFPESAWSIYRTLFELWIVSTFLEINDDNVAVAFINSTKEKIKNESDKFKWAKSAPCFSAIDGEINFNTILKEVKKNQFPDLSNSKFRKTYDFSSCIVHANSHSVFGRVSFMNEKDNPILTGESDYGLSEPAINSVMVINNIVLMLMSTAHNEVSFLGSVFLRQLTEATIESFHSISREFTESVTNET